MFLKKESSDNWEMSLLAAKSLYQEVYDHWDLYILFYTIVWFIHVRGKE